MAGHAQYPRMKTLVDGRQVDMRYFQDYFNATSEPEKYWIPIEKKYQFKIVLLDVSLPISLKLAHYLNDSTHWQLVMVDNTFVTFIKRGVFSLPLAVSSLQESLKTMSVTTQENDEFMRSILSQNFKRRFFDFTHSSQFVDLIEEGVTLLELGYEKAAVKKFVQSLKVDPQMVKQALVVESTP